MSDGNLNSEEGLMSVENYLQQRSTELQPMEVAKPYASSLSASQSFTEGDSKETAEALDVRLKQRFYDLQHTPTAVAAEDYLNNFKRQSKVEQKSLVSPNLEPLFEDINANNTGFIVNEIGTQLLERLSTEGEDRQLGSRLFSRLGTAENYVKSDLKKVEHSLKSLTEDKTASQGIEYLQFKVGQADEDIEKAYQDWTSGRHILKDSYSAAKIVERAAVYKLLGFNLDPAYKLAGIPERSDIEYSGVNINRTEVFATAKNPNLFIFKRTTRDNQGKLIEVGEKLVVIPRDQLNGVFTPKETSP